MLTSNGRSEKVKEKLGNDVGSLTSEQTQQTGPYGHIAPHSSRYSTSDPHKAKYSSMRLAIEKDRKGPVDLYQLAQAETASV